MLRKLWLIFAQACTLALGLLFALQVWRPDWLARLPVAAPPAAPASAARGAEGLVGSGRAEEAVRSAAAAASDPPPAPLARAAAEAAPAVVSISTASGGRLPPAFGAAPGRRGVGSGVIVAGDAAEGFVLTNHHVVDGAQRIEVQLSDGRETVAELVGTDPETDLALLRLPLERLPVIRSGSSKALHVGDPVLAIGNPFGVGQTVTAGIVSALQRQQLGINVFESFIQTDAAINPGNSGGALVDAQGRLVGINSAIYSSGGGSVGLGFAIPVELAQEVMQALRADGQVTRGWVGVTSRALSPELLEALRLPAELRGVLVSGVVNGAPAQRAGLRPGDVIVRVAGGEVASPEQLLERVARLKPGEPAELQVRRGAQTLPMEVLVGQRPVPRR